jgi:hypothetical protein
MIFERYPIQCNEFIEDSPGKDIGKWGWLDHGYLDYCVVGEDLGSYSYSESWTQIPSILFAAFSSYLHSSYM